MSKTKSRGNGTGSVYKEGSTWTAAITVGYYLDKDGKRKRKVKRKKGFRLKSDAILYLPKLREQIDPPKKTTIEELWQFYSENGMKALSTTKQKGLTIAYKRIQDIRFANIADLTVTRLQEVVNETTSTYVTAKDVRMLLSHLYDCAVVDGTVNANLAKYIVLPKNEEERADPFTLEEVASLWRDWDRGNLYTGFPLLMIYTGMMPGEVLQLQKEHIDLDERCIRGAGLKTDKRRQTPITLSEDIVPVLTTLMNASKGSFLWEESRSTFRTKFCHMLTRCGCRETLVPYSCRHTTATVLASMDTEINTIKEVMRHSNIATTTRYVHVARQSVKDAVDSIAPLLHPDEPKSLT